MAAERTSGKSGRDLAPVMLALITSANKQGVHFSPDEVSLILEIFKKRENQRRTRTDRPDGQDDKFHIAETPKMKFRIYLTEKESAGEVCIVIAHVFTRSRRNGT